MSGITRQQDSKHTNVTMSLSSLPLLQTEAGRHHLDDINMTKYHTRLDTKDNILYGSIYMKFWERQNCNDRKQMRGSQGLRVGGEGDCRVRRTLSEDNGDGPYHDGGGSLTLHISQNSLKCTLEIAEFCCMKVISQ